MKYMVVYSGKNYAPMMGFTDDGLGKILSQFTNEVNRQIAAGWTPLGGVATNRSEGAFTL